MLFSYLMIHLNTIHLFYITTHLDNLFSFFFFLNLIGIVFIIEEKINLTNSILSYSLFKNSNFFKESFYIDWFQKKSMDKFFLNSLIISTQFYNLNVWVFSVTKYLYKFLVINFSLLYSLLNNNLGLTLMTMMYYFLILSNLTLIIIFLI